MITRALAVSAIRGVKRGPVSPDISAPIRRAAPTPGEAEAYDAGRDYQSGRKQKARPRTVAVEQGERGGTRSASPIARITPAFTLMMTLGFKG
jgi:hypothetical protein